MVHATIIISCYPTLNHNFLIFLNINSHTFITFILRLRLNFDFLLIVLVIH